MSINDRSWDSVTRLAKKLTTPDVPSNEANLVRRQGVVNVVNNDHTVDIKLGGSGIVIPHVAYLGSYMPVANDTVWVDFRGEDPLVIGTKSSGGQTSWNTGAALSDTATNPINTDIVWGAAQTITNPKFPVAIVAHLSGYIADFVNVGATVCAHAVEISIDGSTYTRGPVGRTVVSQGGLNLNSEDCHAQWWRSGTPSGNILIRAIINSNSLNCTATLGSLTWTIIPI